MLVTIVATFAALVWCERYRQFKSVCRLATFVLKRLHLWLLSLLYLATFGSFIGFSGGLAMLAKTNLRKHSATGALWPLYRRWRVRQRRIPINSGGVRVTLINFIFMVLFLPPCYSLTPPGSGAGSFSAFYLVFMGLFLKKWVSAAVLPSR